MPAPKTDRERAINELAADLPRYWDYGPYDAPMVYAALESLRTSKPRVLYVMLGEGDEWAHAGRYDLYLDATSAPTASSAACGTRCSRCPSTRIKTTLLVTTDHGRGATTADWNDHGKKVPAAESTWMAALGAGVAAARRARVGHRHDITAGRDDCRGCRRGFPGCVAEGGSPAAPGEMSEVRMSDTSALTPALPSVDRRGRGGSPFLSIPTRTAAATLRHASIGAAGQAFSDLQAFAKHPAFELVAVADVDLCRIEPLQQKFPKVRVYQDWREMLKKERANIDSVNVSVPDHMHCLVALEAMKRGKPVYVQKPLCNTLHETRLLTEEARRRGLRRRWASRCRRRKAQRYGEALVRSGIVGKIKEVHTFSNKNWGDDKPLPAAVDPVPAPLDWDDWLGVSEPRPFKRGVYHPGEWRRRIGFGTGTLGDMGCHIYSPPYRALKLTSPVAVTAYGPPPSAESWATKARVKLTYPGTEYTAGKTVDVWWYDGGELPPDALREPIGPRWPQQGSVVVGTTGLLVLPHGSADPFVLRTDGRR